MVAHTLTIQIQMADNPKRWQEEELQEDALRWKRRRDKVVLHPAFLSFIKETATFGEVTDYPMLWMNLCLVFNSSYRGKYEKELLRKIEKKIDESELRWQTILSS